MYTGIKPEELVDPKLPPPKAQGPFVISGNNRYGFKLALISF